MQLLEKKVDNYSIFNRFISLIFLVFISVLLCIGWKTSDLSKKFVQENLIFAAHSINQNIGNSIEYSENKLRFVANLVVEQNLENNYEELYKLFKLLPASTDAKLKLWSYIGWTDNHHITRLNNTGILNSPIDINFRPFMKELPKKPFILNFSFSDQSIINKRKVIPAAMGINNKNGQYIGSITTAIVIENIEAYINSIVKNKNIHYAFINLIDNKMVSHSADFDQKSYIHLKNSIQQVINGSGGEKSLLVGNKLYVIQKISNFPFVVILESNLKSLGYKEYLESLAMYKAELLCAFLIIALLIYLFYHSILDPFLALSATALAISKGDDSISMPRNIHSKEGALVAHALERIKSSLRIEKELVQELSNAHNKLSVNNLRLENKVAERTQELENALKSKTIFLKQLSYEIKLPLQGIATIAENISHYWSELTEAMKLEFIHQLSYNSSKILSLVNNLLDMSSLSTGKKQLNFTKFDIAELTSEIIKECNLTYMHKKSVKINFHKEKPILIMGDQERIGQLLRNLFTNSIRNGSNNSSIAVKLVSSEISYQKNKPQEAVHFIMHDQATNVREEDLAAIFSPAVSETLDGDLLGLKICYEVIMAHHGKIWATNNKDGGATYNFMIPIAQSSTLEAEVDTPSYIDLSNNKTNILIIDDEETCLGSMELLLHGSKYNLIKCNSGQAGLKYLEQHHEFISLVMLDLMMPDIYGLNVLSDIKNNKELNKIPVMLQTGSSDEEEIVKAFNMGINSFVRKPYKKKIVLNEIDKAIRLYNLNNTSPS